MKKILHLISGLDSGGAEKVLIDLVKNDKFNKHYIISFKDLGIYKNIIKSKKIRVYYFNLNKLNFFFKLPIIIKKIYLIKPDISVTWMYYADFIGGLICKLLKIKKIYWNIRNSTLEKDKTKILTYFIFKICAKLSHYIPNKILSCSQNAIDVHLLNGYKKNFYLIPNGIDTNKFKNFNLKKKKEDLFTIGYAGRWHPQKNYNFFFESLSYLKFKMNFRKFKVIIVGEFMNLKNIELCNLIKKFKLEDNINLLDEIDNMENYYNSIDINILTSSYGEAFPNVIAESMSCETPCMSSEIGDVKKIIGNYGWIIKQNDKIKFCKNIIFINKMKKFFPKKWANLKKNSRKRIVKYFSLNQMIKNYNKIFIN